MKIQPSISHIEVGPQGTARAHWPIRTRTISGELILDGQIHQVGRIRIPQLGNFSEGDSLLVTVEKPGEGPSPPAEEKENKAKSSAEVITNLAQKMYERWKTNIQFTGKEWEFVPEADKHAWEDLACFALHDGFPELRNA